MVQPLEQAFLPGEFEREAKLTRERLELFQARGSGTVSYIDELAQPHKDGSIIYTEITTTYLFNPQGRIEIMGVTRDITRRKQAEINHRASEKKYQELLDQASDGIFIADPSGRYTLVNEQACRLVGYTKDELLSMNLRDLVAPEDLQAAPLRLDELRAGKVLITERKLVCKDESRIVCEISAKILPDGSFQSIVRDITERKVTEDALVRSEQRYRSLFENMSNGYARCQMVYDEQGRPVDFIYTDVNNAFKRATGLQDVIGRRVSEVIPGIRDTNPDVLETYGRIAMTGKSETFETYLPGLGAGMWFSVSAYSFERGFFMAVFEAITERKRAEAALQGSYEQLLSFIEQAPLSIAMFDRNMNYLAVSHRWVHEYGRGYPDLIGRNHYDVNPDVPASWKEAHQKGLSGESLKNDDDVWVLADGTKNWLRWAVTPWKKEHGEIGGIIISIEDISERKRAEANAFKNELRYHRVLDAMMEGCQIIDYHWRYLYVNGVVAEQGKNKPEDLLNHTMMEMYPGIEKTELFGILSRCMEHRTSHRFENQFQFPNGSTGWFELSIQPAEEGIFILSTDITERKQAEQKLARQNQRLKALREIDTAILAADSVESIVGAALDHIRELIDCERANLALIDWEKNEAVNFDVRDSKESAISIGARVSLDLIQDILQVLSRNQPVIVDDLTTLPDPPPQIKIFINEGLRSRCILPLFSQGILLGSFTLSSRTTSFFDEEKINLGREVGNQVAIAITQSNLLKDLKGLNEDLEARVIERTAQLEAANKELESFSYSVSHDLRAPLRAIDGYTNILVEDYVSVLDEEGKRVCGIISRETKRMGKLIDDLLSFSRMGRREMHVQQVDMQSLVDSVFDELLRQRDRSCIDLQVAALPPIRGDSALMRQVWINLLSNAIKFTSGRERVIIQVKASQTEEEIVYSVQDNGAGFEMEYVNKLFGVFQRLHSDSEFEGTGVGLAIVQRVIHRHGGRIWAEGRVGEGATFHFALPRRHVES